ncbi:(Fe-S)-binding protein [Granulosicoccaceae sp. 1_MG-2023]|nr:(Fe-S)-binding protein [Granulosicoccaceae sp. 1_MG-2023]
MTNAQVKTPHVGLFVTCLVDAMRPSVGFAAVSLLEDAGCRISVPQAQTCCGQPVYNSGDDADAAALARNTIAAFESFDYVVAPSGSCLAMIKVHYPGLLREDAAWHKRAVALAAKCYELTAFLSDVMQLQLPPGMQPFAHTVTYHDSCSGLRELGIKAQPRQLLSQVGGVQLKEMADTDVCCGFGGTFCVKYPEISTKMVDDKLADAAATQAEVLLGGDLGCLMNIAGRASRQGQPLKVYHIAEVLAGMAGAPLCSDKERS